MKKLIFSWDELKSTFWFFPVLIILMAVFIAFALIYIDSISNFEPGKKAQYLFAGSTESARRVLSIISAAMIGVAGTVFSITLVALSLASSQFGPRLLKNFMYDRINQVVLGTYISTFIYCLIVLNSIKGNEQHTFIPSFSVLFALVAALANIVLLIVFIHHIAISIQADTVISNISETLSGNVKNLFPGDLGKTGEKEGDKEEKHLKLILKYSASLKASESGYLRYIDGDSLFKFSADKQTLIELFCRPGDYLVEGMEIGLIYSDKMMEDDELKKFKSWFLTGKVRTPHQDTEYSIDQMVEIASRALSPGINDPYTAIACIDNLTSTMCSLTVIEFPSKYRYDDEGNLRLIARPLTYEGILDAAFNQIRQFGKAIPSVAVRLIEALIVIDKFAKTRQQKRAIQKHAHMVLSMAEKFFDEPNDLQDLKERSRQILSEN